MYIDFKEFYLTAWREETKVRCRVLYKNLMFMEADYDWNYSLPQALEETKEYLNKYFVIEKRYANLGEWIND